MVMSIEIIFIKKQGYNNITLYNFKWFDIDLGMNKYVYR